MRKCALTHCTQCRFVAAQLNLPKTGERLPANGTVKRLQGSIIQGHFGNSTHLRAFALRWPNGVFYGDRFELLFCYKHMFKSYLENNY
jgi:hypothetical protein